MPEIGLAEADDAAIVRMDNTDVVFTTDFFTPVVDDPFDWGAIAAANAMSDIYAMNAVPLFALNLVGWPREGLDHSLLHEVLRGGAETCASAGAAIVGGHTIEDPVPKYGLAVIGRPAGEPFRIDRAQPGMSVVLTKPIGTGIIATAHKADSCPPRVLAAAVESMRQLNDRAREQLATAGAKAATDVTGFGLLGHAMRMARASGVGFKLHLDQVPVLDGTRELLAQGHVPGGTVRNLEAVRPNLESDLDESSLLLLADAQTSGGLLGIVESADGLTVIGETTDRAGVLEIR